MMSKQQLYLFMRKAHKFLKEHPEDVILKKIKVQESGICFVGFYDPAEEKMEVDYRRDFLSTFVHELLHHHYPSWPETRVYLTERAIMNQLSLRQIKNLIKSLAAAI